MENYLEKVNQIYELFCGSGQEVIFLLMLLVLMLKISDNKLLKMYILYPILAELIFIMNPISIRFFVNTGLLAENRYVRLFWLMQIGILVAAAVCECFGRLQKSTGKMRVFLGILLAMIIILMGKSTLTKENYQTVTNAYKLPEGVIEVVDTIESDCLRDGVDLSTIKIAVPVSLAPYIRQYRGDIKMLYGRNIENDVVSSSVQRLMQEEELKPDQISVFAKKGLCNYIVLEDNKPLTEPFEEYGYELVDVVKGYAVYKDLTIDKND